MARSPSSSSYVKPVVGQFRRLDQGVDIQGTPGDHVVAVGLARISAIKSDPGGFGTAIYYTLLTGPDRGRQVYIGHAAPVANLHAGQLVQAGDPVATLLQSGLGNAAGLAGWVEIGFAKNGVPDPGTAKEFQRLMNAAGDAPAQPVAPAAPDTSATTPTDTPVSPPVAGQDQDLGLTPNADTTVPFEPSPGSGIDSTNQFVVDAWDRIASQPGASADTQLLASNASVALGV